MKKILVGSGSLIAILLMFSPLIVICLMDKINKPDFYFYFVCSILYDIYMYTIINQNNYINETKELFDKVFNGKAINSKTEEEKLNWYKVICIDMFMNKFNKDKK